MNVTQQYIRSRTHFAYLVDGRVQHALKEQAKRKIEICSVSIFMLFVVPKRKKYTAA
jgi:hypothetical protein